MKAPTIGITLLLLGTLPIGLSPGCATEDCDEAWTNLGRCMSGFETWGYRDGEKLECSGLLLCQSKCVNEVDCEAIKDAYSGMSTAISKGLLDCSTRCAEEN